MERKKKKHIHVWWYPHVEHGPLIQAPPVKKSNLEKDTANATDRIVITEYKM